MPVMPYADKQDSAKFGETPEDPTIRAEMEGGYEVTRARHTRVPRRTWTSGLTYMTEVEKAAYVTFVDSVRVGSASFDWANPNTLAVHIVRFTKSPTYKYVGKGTDKRWDIDFEVREV